MRKLLQQKRQKWRREFRRYRVLMGKQSMKYGLDSAANTFQMHRESVKYWCRKVLDPTFHSQSWGGARHWLLKGEKRRELLHLIWFFCKRRPLSNLAEIRNFLLQNGFDVKLSFLRSVFWRWRWSFKKPSVHQMLKYRLENVLHYVTHCKVIQGLEKSKIKFLDESSFKARGT